MDTTNLPQQILVGVWQIEGLLGLLIVVICLVAIVAAQAASTLPGRAGNR
jgi:O-antigen ligase